MDLKSEGASQVILQPDNKFDMADLAQHSPPPLPPSQPQIKMDPDSEVICLDELPEAPAPNTSSKTPQVKAKTDQMACRLFVGNLPQGATTDSLAAYFISCQGFLSANVPGGAKDRNKRCYGFLNFQSAKAADAALAKYKNTIWSGHKLLISAAIIKKRTNAAARKKQQGVQNTLVKMEGAEVVDMTLSLPQIDAAQQLPNVTMAPVVQDEPVSSRSQQLAEFAAKYISELDVYYGCINSKRSHFASPEQLSRLLHEETVGGKIEQGVLYAIYSIAMITRRYTNEAKERYADLDVKVTSENEFAEIERERQIQRGLTMPLASNLITNLCEWIAGDYDDHYVKYLELRELCIKG